MTIKHLKILSTVLIFTMSLTALASAVFAAETPSFELPVTVKLSGLPPANDEDYKIILEADNSNYPIPLGSKDGIYTLIITGEDTVKLPKIQYSSVGIYTYKIYQLEGTNRLTTYDDTEYQLVVYVTNAENGSGLEITVLLYLVGEEGKLDEVIFENEYDRRSRPDRPDQPDPPDEPDPSPQPDPPSVDETIEIEDPPLPEGVPDPEVPVEEVELDDPIIPGGAPDPPASDKPDVPKTGDDTMIWPYVGLFISGVATLILLGFTIKKKQIDE